MAYTMPGGPGSIWSEWARLDTGFQVPLVPDHSTCSVLMTVLELFVSAMVLKDMGAARDGFRFCLTSTIGATDPDRRK